MLYGYEYYKWLQWSHRIWKKGFHETRVILRLRHFSLFSASAKLPFVHTVVGICLRVFRVALQTGKFLKCAFFQVFDYCQKLVNSKNR